MTIRMDPRIVESLKAELKVQRDRIPTLTGNQRDAAQAHLAQLEEQFKRVTNGVMGVSQ